MKKFKEAIAKKSQKPKTDSQDKKKPEEEVKGKSGSSSVEQKKDDIKNPKVKDAPTEKTDEPVKDSSDKKNDISQKKSPDKDDADTKGKDASAKKTAPKSKGPEITDKVKVDLEPMLEQYLFEGDLSDVSDYIDVVEECAAELELLGEALSVAQRVRRRAIMRRSRARIRLGRQRAMRRRAVQSRINNRARRSAISLIKRRVAGGRNPNTLSFAERARVENVVKRRKRAVSRLQKRLVRIKRQQDNARFRRK